MDKDAKYKPETNFSDFVGCMITELEADTMAMAVATFFRDHIDSQSSTDFVNWLMSCETPESAAEELHRNLNDGDTQNYRNWIADDEHEAFFEYAEKQYGFLIQQRQ